MWGLEWRDIYYEEDVNITEFPTKVYLRESGFVPTVLDQGRLGSCVTNATANGLEFCLKKEKEIDFLPSRLYMYYYTRLIEGNPNKDTGCTIRDCMKEISTYGVCPESMFPYDISKFTIRPSNECMRVAREHIDGFRYVSVRQNARSIKEVLVSGYPIIFGVDVYESFQSREAMETGDIPMPNVWRERLLGGHAILMTGYDDESERFTFENSWDCR
jgi:C1A family cysteine protease